MSDETLGTAQVEITAALAPLQKGLADARAAVESGTAQMQASIGNFSSQSGQLLEGLTGTISRLAAAFGVGFGLKEGISVIEDNEYALARLGAVLQ